MQIPARPCLRSLCPVPSAQCPLSPLLCLVASVPSAQCPLFPLSLLPGTLCPICPVPSVPSLPSARCPLPPLPPLPGALGALCPLCLAPSVPSAPSAWCPLSPLPGALCPLCLVASAPSAWCPLFPLSPLHGGFCPLFSLPLIASGALAERLLCVLPCRCPAGPPPLALTALVGGARQRSPDGAMARVWWPGRDRHTNPGLSQPCLCQMTQKWIWALGDTARPPLC